MWLTVTKTSIITIFLHRVLLAGQTAHEFVVRVHRGQGRGVEERGSSGGSGGFGPLESVIRGA